MKTLAKIHGPGAAHLNYSMFGARGPLRNKEGEGGGGGGGDDDPKFEERFNKLFHKAMGEREARLEKKLMKTLGDTMNTSLSKHMDDLRQILVDDGEGEGREKPGERERERERGGDVKLPPEIQAQIKKSTSDAAEAKKMAEEWKTKAEQERVKNQRAEERQQLQSLLSGKVKPAVLDMLVDQLHQKNVSRDEETGAILWKDSDGSVVPLKDGVGSWAKSDLAKEFAPPRDTRGTGGRGADGDLPTKPGTMTIDALSDIVSGSMGRR